MVEFKNLKEFISQKKKIIDDYLNDFLPEPEMYPSNFHNAMHYGVFNGGKRIRPIITLAVTDMLNGDEDIALPAACSIELVHCSSLLLDDLSCMDEGLIRRGKETCHLVFGEDIAILASVGLLNLAFNLLTNLEKNGVGRKLTIELIQKLNSAIGSEGLIAGQTIDLKLNWRTVDFETLEYVNSHKTGALLVAAAEFGALLSEATKKQVNALSQYAKNLGLAYQIIDDILDVEGNAGEIGKDIGKDAKKTNFISFYGKEGAKKIADELIQFSIDSIKKFDQKAAILIELAQYVNKRKDKIKIKESASRTISDSHII